MSNYIPIKYRIQDKETKPKKFGDKSRRPTIWGKPGYIYFIRSENKKIKIGITKNVERRFKYFQKISPCKLELIAVIVGSTYMEKDLHRKFKEYNDHNEWFDEVPEIIDFIKRWVGMKGNEVLYCKL